MIVIGFTCYLSSLRCYKLLPSVTSLSDYLVPCVILAGVSSLVYIPRVLILGLFLWISPLLLVSVLLPPRICLPVNRPLLLRERLPFCLPLSVPSPDELILVHRPGLFIKPLLKLPLGSALWILSM